MLSQTRREKIHNFYPKGEFNEKSVLVDNYDNIGTGSFLNFLYFELRKKNPIGQVRKNFVD
jgi:hypothetical protein